MERIERVARCLCVWPWMGQGLLRAVWRWLRRRCRIRPALHDEPAWPQLAPASGFTPARLRRRGGRPKPPWVRQWVLRRHDEGVSSPHTLAAEFNREFAVTGLSICKSTAHNWIVAHSARALAVRVATRNRVPGPTPANLRWCLDCTGKGDSTGQQHCALGIMDHGTRFALQLARLSRPSAWAILARLFDAIDRHGKPTLLRTDNAAVFHGPVFKAVLAALGIRHEFIELGCPWQNRIERFFLTLKQVLNKVVPRDGHALDSMLSEFTFWYNDVRPHQHLHGFTPAEVWRGVNPYEVVPKEVHRFEGWGGLLKGFHLRR